MLPTYAFVPNITNPWWIAGSSIDLKFTASLYYDSAAGGPTAVTNLLSISRASIGYAQNSDGTLTQFGNDTLRIGVGTGLLVEDARTNVVLWSRDLTNAAWTPTNITAAKDQTGPDGVTNSASSILATAGNGTILQSITLATAPAFQSAYVKRITGTGTVNMTMDNGSTWTAITPTSAWTQVTIPTQTLANPTVGFQIVTSGDKIAVDFVQNENGTFVSSPIPTTTTSAARAQDLISCIGDLDTMIGISTGSLIGTCVVDIKTNATLTGSARIVGNSSGVNNTLLYRQSDTAVGFYNSSVNPQATLGNSLTFLDGVKVGIAFNEASGLDICGGGGTTVNINAAVPLNTAGASLGNSVGGNSAEQMYGYYRRLTAWNSRLSAPTLQALTAP